VGLKKIKSVLINEDNYNNIYTQKGIIINMCDEQKKVSPPTSHFDRLLESRIIWIGTDVNDAMAAEICAKLLLLSAEAFT
jgi:ATP-dependent protease ClpP protease subunit